MATSKMMKNLILVISFNFIVKNSWCDNLRYTQQFHPNSQRSTIENHNYPPRLNNTRSTTSHNRVYSTTEHQVISTEAPKPVIDPEKCPGNQLYYPGNPWFCDCGPRYIYYEPEGACYQAYMQGPCPENQHLVVRNIRGRSRVQCVNNPCEEGYVRYENSCYELEKSDGPCEKIDDTTAILKINPDTLDVECTKTSADKLTLFNFPQRCPPGSKRDSTGKCRDNWNV